MTPPPASRLAELIGRPVSSVETIAENKYCGIFRGMSDGQPVIFKQYKAGDPILEQREADGVRLYHDLARADDRLMDSDVLGFDAADRLIAIGFVPGARLADAVRDAAGDGKLRDAVFAAMWALGETLVAMRNRTLAEGTPLDPFHFEYLRHCSGKLAGLPVVGRRFYGEAPAKAELLVNEITRARPAVSMAHGDFVFRNIHIRDGRIGLIDFANTLPASHPLNDIVNLWFSLQNMRLDPGYREALWGAFRGGFGAMDFGNAEWRFFFEYHRRRWLMLNLAVRNPARWILAARAQRGFARRTDNPARRVIG